MNDQAFIQRANQRVAEIKAQLAALGDMHPGSLSRQYNVCGKPGCRCKDPHNPRRHGPYYQISYVHQGKSTTRFVQRHLLGLVKTQLANYKRFRRLTEEWVALALKIASRNRQAAVESAKPQSKQRPG